MPETFIPYIISLATIFIGALAGGRLAALCHVPRVTGYLVAGLLLGPSFAELFGLPQLITREALSGLRILSDIALALIMLNIGAQFRTENLRLWRLRIVLFSLSEIFLTFLLVATCAFLVNGLHLHQHVAGLGLWASSLYFGLFLGIIAAATAPAATLMVVREYDSQGPVTSTVLTLVGLNNLVSVLLFVFAAHFLVRPEEGLGLLLLKVGGPLAAGALIGLVLSFWAQRLELASEHKILLLGGVIATTALSRSLQIDPMLANLVLGYILSNTSPRWNRLVESLWQVDYPLYVAFFVIAGATLHFETLAHIGLLGVAYVAARTGGKLLGAYLGARLGRFRPRQRIYVGPALLAQAGVAIGLAATLAREWPEAGHLIETVVLGAVVVFELTGPLAVRFSLVRAGEVPILSLLQKRAPQGALEGLHNVVQHFRNSLGLPAGHRVEDPGDILVKHVMRQNVETVRDNTPFNELLRLIAHSRYDRFPVVDESGHFVGMINYTEIRNLLFEPSLAPLIVASDLATATPHSIAPDQPLREVLKTLQLHRNISFFPVIDPEKPQHLLGILSQNDVFSAFRRLGEG